MTQGHTRAVRLDCSKPTRKRTCSSGYGVSRICKRQRLIILLWNWSLSRFDFIVYTRVLCLNMLRFTWRVTSENSQLTAGKYSQEDLDQWRCKHFQLWRCMASDWLIRETNTYRSWTYNYQIINGFVNEKENEYLSGDNVNRLTYANILKILFVFWYTDAYMTLAFCVFYLCWWKNFEYVWYEKRLHEA